MRYLVTGERGFLLSSVINELDGEVISYEYGESYPNIDIVIHFASPNDRYEFQDKVNMAHTMVDYSLAVVEEARKNGAKFIFASSKAAGICADEYGVYKRFLEQYIEANIYDHLIYRIPSVYGSNRQKGLMRQLREDDLDDPLIKELVYKKFVGVTTDVITKVTEISGISPEEVIAAEESFQSN